MRLFTRFSVIQNFADGREIYFEYNISGIYMYIYLQIYKYIQIARGAAQKLYSNVCSKRIRRDVTSICSCPMHFLFVYFFTLCFILCPGLYCLFWFVILGHSYIYIYFFLNMYTYIYMYYYLLYQVIRICICRMYFLFVYFVLLIVLFVLCAFIFFYLFTWDYISFNLEGIQ